MMCFIGIHCNGNSKAFICDDYWAKFITLVPWHSSVTSRNNFKNILRLLHFLELQRVYPDFDQPYKLENIENL